MSKIHFKPKGKVYYKCVMGFYSMGFREGMVFSKDHSYGSIYFARNTFGEKIAMPHFYGYTSSQMEIFIYLGHINKIQIK